MTRSTSSRPIDERLLALVVRTAPSSFRALHEDELIALYARRRTRRDGVAARVALFLTSLADAFRVVFLLWRDEWSRLPAHSALFEPRRPGESRMTSLIRDATLTLRVLVHRHRSFTALSVLTLALGLGATTAIFTVVHGVLLAPLPYGEPERIVKLYQSATDGGFGQFSGPNFLRVRERLESFEVMAAYDDYTAEGLDWTGGERVERLSILRVGSGYFETLGVEPLFGRTFERSDELPPGSETRPVDEYTPGGSWQPVAILSHRLWQTRFGGDASAVGTWIELEEQPHEIVGVMPARVGGHAGGAPDLWLPLDLALGGRNVEGNHFLSAVARLRDGVSLDAATSELERATAQLRAEHPRINEDVELAAVAFDELILGPSRSMIVLLFGAVGAMLAIACINVANLFLARGLGRRRELAVRSALGAGARRLFVGALLESLWIGVAGGLLGLGIAWLSIRWLLALRPAALPRYDALELSLPVFGFSAFAVLATVVAFGLLPALQAMRADARDGFGGSGGSGARGGIGGRRERRLRDLAVSLQVALALVLLTAGGLLARSFFTLDDTDLGFETAGVTAFELRLPDYAYSDPDRRVAFYRQLFDRLDALPGVAASGATSKLPGNGHRNHWGFGIVGRERQEGDPWTGAEFRCVAGGLFEALSMPIVVGRDFDRRDVAGAERVVIVNRALADHHFPAGDAVGQRLTGGGGDPRTIVGVVENALHDPREEAVPKIYVPQPQFADNRNWDLSFVVAQESTEALGQSALGQRELMTRVRGAVASIDPRLVVYDEQPLAEIAAEPIARQRFSAQLMTIFAAMSLLLSAVGLFGALAYSLGRRRAEIGMRMALGADRRDVLASVVGQGLRVYALGAALGLLGVLAVRRWLASLEDSLLQGARADDPTVLLLALGVLLAASALAALEPARRALRLDPATILREE